MTGAHDHLTRLKQKEVQGRDTKSGAKGSKGAGKGAVKPGASSAASVVPDTAPDLAVLSDVSVLCSESGAAITTQEELLEAMPSAAENPLDVLLAMVSQFHTERRLRLELASQVAGLIERMDRWESAAGERDSVRQSLGLMERLSELEDRQLRAEAYSGRNTVIIAGLSDPGKDRETPADLEERVLDVLSVADSTIKPEDLGICHRNSPRRGKHRGKPRTVTVVFTRAQKKDHIMTRANRAKVRNRVTDDQEEGKKSGGIFHRMSRSLVERKEELEKVPGVQWVYFSGHHLFSVKLERNGKEEVLHNILSANQLN